MYFNPAYTSWSITAAVGARNHCLVCSGGAVGARGQHGSAEESSGIQLKVRGVAVYYILCAGEAGRVVFIGRHPRVNCVSEHISAKQRS